MRQIIALMNVGEETKPQNFCVFVLCVGKCLFRGRVMFFMICRLRVLQNVWRYIPNSKKKLGVKKYLWRFAVLIIQHGLAGNKIGEVKTGNGREVLL